MSDAKYSKHQQNYINAVGGALAHPAAVAIIGKLEMTIAMLMGAARLAGTVLRNCNIDPRVSANGPPISEVINTAIADAERGGMVVIDSYQLVEVLKMAREKLMVYRQHSGDEYQGGMEYTALMGRIDDALGIKPSDGMHAPMKEYRTIVYY